MLEVTVVDECYGAEWGYDNVGSYINEDVVYVHLHD